MKKGFLLFSTCLVFICLTAQQASFEGTKSTSSVLLQKVIPPSPTAASLGKYGDQQINMFTGTSSVSIPIYEIKTNGFSIPLSLSYASSGLRVTEAASWVGLGWSLNGMGVITRVVKGAPDGVRNPIDVRIWPLPTSYSGVSDNAYNYVHSQLQGGGGFDQEPDMFIVRGGKLNFKFYYDLNKRIQTVPYNNNVKIKLDNALNQYVITDDDGTQYFFGGPQSTETTSSANPAYANYTSSWFLSKIITPVGAQILYNNTISTTSISQDQYSESEEVKPGGQVGDCAALSPSGRTVSYSTQTIIPVFLNSIETDQEIVYFIRSAAQRADMPGDYSLSDVKVYSKSSGNYEYNYSFTYSYFPQVSSVCWGSTSSPAHVHNTTAICKRLRLDNFVEKGNGANTSNFKTYGFEYSTKPVPSRCSLDQDFWGYYNGAGNTSLLPAVSDPDFQSSSYNAISREANHNFSDAGLLLKISYPTGGESNFVYEPNELNTLSSTSGFQTATASLSGISPSLSASTIFSISSIQPVIINFTLTDANLIDQGLQRKAEIIDGSGNVIYSAMNFNTNSDGIVVYSNIVTLGGLIPGTYTLKISRNYLYSSYPTIPATGIIASVQYLASGTVTVINRKIGGFRIRKVSDKTDPLGAVINVKEFIYDNPFLIANIKNSDCIASYTRWGLSTTTQLSYQCRFKSRTTNSVQPMGTIQGSHIGYGKVIRYDGGVSGNMGRSEFIYSTAPDVGGYSLTPIYRPITSYDHRRGNLLTQTDYDAIGNTKRVKSNVYNYSAKYVGTFSFPFYSRDEPLGTAGNINPSLSPQKVISFSDFSIISEWVRLASSSETIYSGSDYISTTTQYIYGNQNYSMPTITKTTNSKNQEIANNITYPLDYKPVSTKSNEEIERQFETDYQAIYNTFVTCSNAASTSTAINACYTSYQTSYDNLLNNRTLALANYHGNFTTLANGTADPILKGKYQLLAKNKVTEVIENKTTKDGSTELNKTTNDYKDFSGNVLLEKVNKSFSGNTLENEITVNAYDAYGNILQATPKDGVVRSYLWDYQFKFPIAEVNNASQNDIAYTSFEADAKGNWTYSGTPVNDVTAPTGKKAYNLSAGNITESVTSTVSYIISYWRPTALSALTITGTQAGYPIAGRTVNGWKYYEHRVTGVTSLTLSGAGNIDELRLYPINALMTTSAYEPLIGLKSRCDANNRINYYDYDVFGRLVLVRDQDKKIVNKICYNYAGQPENCLQFLSVDKSGTYTRNDCGSGLVGSSVSISIPAGMFVSTISQSDADQQALNYGQAQANATGTCISQNVSVVLVNNTGVSGYRAIFTQGTSSTQFNFTSSGSTTATLPPGTYTVNIAPSGGGTTRTFTINTGPTNQMQSGAGATFGPLSITSTCTLTIN